DPERGGLAVLVKVEAGEAVTHAGARRDLAEEALHRVRRRGGRAGGGTGAPGAVGGGIAVLVGDRRLLGVVRPLRPAGDAALGGDDDDAVRRVGAVQRGGRRPADDLHRRDLLRVQVADAAGGGAADAHRRGSGGALDPDAVDDVDRVVGEGERAVAADADADAG